MWVLGVVEVEVKAVELLGVAEGCRGLPRVDQALLKGGTGLFSVVEDR